MNQVTASILPNEECYEGLTTKQICAGQKQHPVHDACHVCIMIIIVKFKFKFHKYFYFTKGDSGGAFVMKDKTTSFFYLAGIVR